MDTAGVGKEVKEASSIFVNLRLVILEVLSERACSNKCNIHDALFWLLGGQILIESFQFNVLKYREMHSMKRCSL